MSGDEGGADDLSGDWIGFYNYPVPAPPTQFEAVLRDTGGLLAGITTEVVDWAGRPGMTLQAVIEGQREGDAVRFTKIYDDLDHAANTIFYEGLVQPGGDEIEGRWTIAGLSSGTFMMVRGRPERAAATRETEADITIDR
jgi:hypothetical protein